MLQHEQKWLVAVERRFNPRDSQTEWLVCVAWDPYRKGGNAPLLTSSEVSDAFVFSTLAAAEMAAVWCGGVVERAP
jgi:hypothetical protein